MTECNPEARRKATPRRQRHSGLEPRPAEQISLDDARSTYLDFPLLGSRQVRASFDGGDISSDGGSLLLRKAEELTGPLDIAHNTLP